MAGPINNGLHNISPAGLSSRAASSGVSKGSSAEDSLATQSATSANPAPLAPSSGSAMRPLAGNSRSLSGAGQNIDWFSDLDVGSKLPIALTDRLQGKTIQEMTDIIMGHLGLRN